MIVEIIKSYFNLITLIFLYLCFLTKIWQTCEKGERTNMWERWIHEWDYVDEMWNVNKHMQHAMKKRNGGGGAKMKMENENRTSHDD